MTKTIETSYFSAIPLDYDELFNFAEEATDELEKYQKLYEARGEVMAVSHLLFEYAQKMSHKIKSHKLEKLLPTPDKELQAYLEAVDKSREVHRNV